MSSPLDRWENGGASDGAWGATALENLYPRATVDGNEQYASVEVQRQSQRISFSYGCIKRFALAPAPQYNVSIPEGAAYSSLGLITIESTDRELQLSAITSTRVHRYPVSNPR